MEKICPLSRATVTALSVYAVALVTLPGLTASAASTIYYCPDRKGDQQYSAQSGPDCVPLADTTKQDQNAGAPQRHYQPDDLQQDVSAFLTRYQKFLDCCKTDLSELREV
jgi:hypothetical protein